MHFETNESRKLKALRWFACPNRHDGLGFKRLTSQPDAAELLAAWVLLLQIASRGPREQRGQLARDGRPLEAGTIALMTGFPAPMFARALTFFASAEQGWLSVEYAPGTEPATQPEMPLFPGTPADYPSPPASSAATVQTDRTGKTSLRAAHAARGGDFFGRQDAAANGKKQTRAPDPLYEELCRIVGTPPDQLTEQAARKTGVCLAAIRSACKKAGIELTREELAARARKYHETFPRAVITAPALANQWARLEPKRAAQPPPIEAEPANWVERFVRSHTGWVPYEGETAAIQNLNGGRVVTWAKLPPQDRAQLVQPAEPAEVSA